MRHGNDMYTIRFMSEDDLKREFMHAASAMPSVNANEPFGIGQNVRECNVNGNAKVARGHGAPLPVPVGR
jgi:hypothetical protein